MTKAIRICAVGLALLAMAACTRTLQAATAAVPTSTSSSQATSPAEATMDAIRAAFMTQTAVANPQAALSTQAVPQATDTFVPLSTVALGTSVPTDTPMPEASSTPEATSTLLPYATPTPGVPATYTLQKGDYPYCIARRFNVSVSELLSLNKLSTGVTYYPGLVLKMPQTGHAFGSGRVWHAHPDNYTVEAGDTLNSIACWYGDLDPLEIAEANGLSSPYTVTAGQTLSIP